MFEAVHPEVLVREWIPPVVLGRAVELAEVLRRLDAPRPKSPGPWIVVVSGPAGSGTSVVARRAAREVVDRLRADGSPNGRVLAVRTFAVRHTHGVASALLRHLDEGFDGRGFGVTEILAGLLRRLRRDGRPTVIVLDDVSVGGPDLGTIVRAIADPDRFLPEGESGLPPTWLLLAGRTDAFAAVEAGCGPRVDLGAPVTLGPYSDRMLATIVAERAERALGHPLATPRLGAVVERAIEDGASASRALDLLRREVVIGRAVPSHPALSRATRPPAVEVEPRVVHAIESAARGREARVGDVRRCEAELASARGERPLPVTTLWRRIVRLEQAGYVRREIRPGGIGGTRSVLRVLTPVDEWVTTTRPRGTRPSAGWLPEPWSGEGSPSQRSTPLSSPPSGRAG